MKFCKLEKQCLKTSNAIKNMFTNLNKFTYHYEIVNNIKCYLGKYNINEFAYNPICSSGYNNTNLHYPHLMKKLKKIV